MDYNNGFCMVAAIDKYICFSISRSHTGTSNIFAKDLNQNIELDIKQDIKPVKKQWANYLLGVLEQLRSMKLDLANINMVFSSNLPIGIGLSSSAALECGFMVCLDRIFNLSMSKEQIIRICQRAENDFVGVKCGIMDQFVNIFSRKDNFLKLDCDTLDYNYIPMNSKLYSIILLNSGVKHSLVESEYNNRRSESSKVLDILREEYSHIDTFRDVEQIDIIKIKKQLDNKLLDRAIYIVREIERVKNAEQAMLKGDFETIGKLMYRTHQGLSKKYCVSCDEIDFLVDNIKTDKYVFGSRIMGGGFGGCTINIVKKGYENKVISTIKKKYFSKFQKNLIAYNTKLVDGTHILENFS